MFLLILIALLTLGWFYVKHVYSYWERRGFPTDKDASIPYGCLGSTMRKEKNMGMAIYDLYLRSKERFVGTYLLFRPAVLIRDADLAKKVLAQDFASFHDRGVYVNEEKDPLSASLFALPGQSWRSMRQKLSPCFTSGKLKGMYSTSEDIGNKMVAHLQSTLPEQGSMEVDVKEVSQLYAIDIIASVIFGLEINSYENPQNKFKQIISILRRTNGLSALFGILVFLIPSLAKFIFALGLRNDFGLAMLAIVKDTIEYREKHDIVRKDMLQLLMQLKSKGSVDDDDDTKGTNIKTDDEGHIESMSLEAITAQGIIFYIAGQETTGSTAAFTLFELAQYPEHLKRLQKEIDDTLSANDGKISYDTLNKMEFLDMCVQETVRKYPGLPMLNRVCTQDYTIPDTNHVIKKGTSIIVSLYGLHHDAEHFPDPETYDPNRFAPEIMNYNPTAYMPFGEGPRICIAQRMGRVNVKLAVVKLLQNFNLEIMPKQELKFEPNGIALLPKDGVKVRMSKRLPN